MPFLLKPCLFSMVVLIVIFLCWPIHCLDYLQLPGPDCWRRSFRSFMYQDLQVWCIYFRLHLASYLARFVWVFWDTSHLWCDNHSGMIPPISRYMTNTTRWTDCCIKYIRALPLYNVSSDTMIEVRATYQAYQHHIRT